MRARFSTDALDLVSKLLTTEPRDRLSLGEIVKHPYLKDQIDRHGCIHLSPQTPLQQKRKPFAERQAYDMAQGHVTAKVEEGRAAKRVLLASSTDPNKNK